MKLVFLGSPVLPTDYVFFPNLSFLSQFAHDWTYLLLFAALLAGLGTVISLLFTWTKNRGNRSQLWQRYKVKLNETFLALISAYLLAGSLFQYGSLLERVLSHHFTKHPFDRYMEMRGNGFAFTMIMTAKTALNIPRPAGYTRERIKQIIGPNALTGAHFTALNSPVAQNNNAPNIVLLLMESVIDPKIFGDHTPVDPIINIRSMGANGVSATFISPVFGGITANVEFETLTGISTLATPRGTYPYQHFISRDILSVAHMLRSRGYQTVALHNWWGSFWNRRNVFPHLGINLFKDMADLELDVTAGHLPTEKELFDELADKLEAATQPVFTLVITMSTHAPYTGHVGIPNNKTRIKLTPANPLSQNPLRTNIEDYLTALYNFDKQLGILVNRIKLLERETIIIAFGDHLPSLGSDFRTYQLAGIIADQNRANWKLTESKAMSSTPIVYWSNKRKLMNKFDLGSGNITSSFYLPLDILNLAGVKLDHPFYQYLAQMRRRFPAIHSQFLIDQHGLLRRWTPKDTEDYMMLCYDQLFGKRYSGPIPLRFTNSNLKLNPTSLSD